MTTPEFVVIYDIVEQGLGWSLYLLLLGFLYGVVVGARNIVKIFREGQLGFVEVCGILVFVICLVFWIGTVGTFVGNLLWDHWRYISWAKNEDFHIAEGHVEGYRTTKSNKWNARESFTVGGVSFFLDDSDIFRTGFNKTSRSGGPFRAGLYTRISFREGCILKIEIVE